MSASIKLLVHQLLTGKIDVQTVMAEGLRAHDLSTLASELDDIATQAAALSAYFETRGGSGCGDSGHAAAIRQSDKRRKVARKALGFIKP